MKKIIVIALFLIFCSKSFAQQFIDKAEIEFEVNTNLKKKMGNGSWEEKMKDNISDLKTSYYKFTFANNKSIYKFDRWSEKTRIPNYLKDEDEESSWFYDYNSNTQAINKQVSGTNFLILDTISKIDWVITNESQIIAGYNCKKAVGKIFKDVYVFAFYTNDILITGGPVSINGLPGMILGLTIPRLYTSYLATKVNVTKVDETILKPLTAKKSFKNKEFQDLLIEKTKDWFTFGDDKAENERQKNIYLWEAYL